MSDTIFRHVLCFSKRDNHRGLAIIVLRAVTIYRPETQTNKLKLTLANSSLLSDVCHLNVVLVRLLSLKWEKWQNSDKSCKLVTLTSSARYAIGGIRIDRGGGLGLEIPVIFELYGDPKYLARLNELINSAETAKRLLKIEHEGVSSPKEREEKSASSSEEVRMTVQTIQWI